MNDLIKQVKEKQEQIQELQKEATKRAGRKEQLLKQLKTEFEVSSKKEAQALLVEFTEAKKENEESLEEINKELEEIISSAQAGATE